MTSPDDKLREMTRVIQVEHAGQTRNKGQTPYWEHCESVSRILSDLLDETGEATGEDLTDILLAAKGHDLYEDTRVDTETIRKEFGERVHTLIEGMTNRGGDSNRSAYVERMKVSPEEVRLIKLADLLDNYRSGATAFSTKGPEWVKGFLLPILDEMWAVVKKTQFVHYQKTAEKLFTAIDDAQRKLHALVDK